MSFEKLHIRFFRDLVEEKLSQQGLGDYYRTQMNIIKESIDRELSKNLSPADREEIMREALRNIKREPKDDKTPARYIEALKEWEDRVCKISFEALKKIEGVK